MVGTGALAPYMAAAHCAVRRHRARAACGGGIPTRAERTAAALAAQGLPATAVARLDKRARGRRHRHVRDDRARAGDRGAWVRAGTHVDLVGAFTREMRESDDDLVARAEVFVDTFAGALKEAGDLVQPMRRRRDHARPRARGNGRPRAPARTRAARDRDAMTLFKSVGTALEDLCAARLVAARARLTAGYFRDPAAGAIARILDAPAPSSRAGGRMTFRFRQGRRTPCHRSTPDFPGRRVVAVARRSRCLPASADDRAGTRVRSRRSCARPTADVLGIGHRARGDIPAHVVARPQ